MSVIEALAVAAIARRIAAFAGLDPPAWVLAARARERAARRGSDLAGYAWLLDGDEGELSALAEALRVGETRFFRHRAHIEALRRTVIPGRARTSARLRAWSAGCSTGEEAWTLAMLLGEQCDDFEVQATDLSLPALEAARAGRYRSATLEHVPAALRQRWFVDEPGGSARVAEALRSRVRFEQRNLLARPYPRGCDVILCRNVLIYFAAPHRDEVVVRLADSLLPGGYLFLGYSETLRSHEDLFVAERDAAGALVYRKREGRREPAVMPARPVRPLPARAPVASVAAIDVVCPVLTPGIIRLQGIYDGAAIDRLTRELRPLLDGAARSIDLDGAEFLGDEAARVLARIAETVTRRIRVRASRPSVRRWLERHRLGTRFVVDASESGGPDGE